MTILNLRNAEPNVLGYLGARTKTKYIVCTMLNIKSNVKSFCSFVKKLKSDKTITVGMHLDGIHANNKLSVCNLFSQYLGSVYLSCILDAVMPVECHRILESIEISEADVYKVVRELDCNTNPDPDGVPTSFKLTCFYTITLLLMPLRISPKLMRFI